MPFDAEVATNGEGRRRIKEGDTYVDGEREVDECGKKVAIRSGHIRIYVHIFVAYM